MAIKDEVGRRGEQLAADFLERMGYTIAARNWRCREGELDIVAHDRQDTVVICEVKTRSGLRYGSGAESVTAGKRRRIRRLGLLWLADVKGRPTLRLRFDVISVLAEPGGIVEIRHIQGAF